MKRIIPEEIKECISYNPETGEFTWLVDRKHNKTKGKIILSIEANGYNTIGFGGIRYKAHRVAFFLMGEEVPDLVDHKDQNKSNNKWNNLRPANHAQNVVNAKVRKNSGVKFRGVDYRPSTNNYRSRVTIKGKTVCIGHYPTAEEAAKAYNEVAKSFYGDYVMLNVEEAA